jgi:hypothetical protein
MGRFVLEISNKTIKYNAKIVMGFHDRTTANYYINEQNIPVIFNKDTKIKLKIIVPKSKMVHVKNFVISSYDKGPNNKKSISKFGSSSDNQIFYYLMLVVLLFILMKS